MDRTHRSRRQQNITRRDLMVKGSCALSWIAVADRMRAVAQAPPTRSTGAVGPVMQTLSTYMADAATRALPAEVIEQTKEHVLDTLAAMISGSQLPPGRKAIAFAGLYPGDPVATVVASDLLCDPFQAAMLNGVLAHSDETDDSHSPSQSHPGCAVVPAALAAGEVLAISGMQFLRAVTLGYDVDGRVGMTLGGVNYQTETHRDPHSISAGFGAAAAAACAASLDATRMRFVLDYAAQQAGGITAWQRDKDHSEKAFVFAGMPARDGVTAALLVHAGWTGVSDIFSGKENFFEAYAPTADAHGLIEQLGQRYEISRTNIKKWSVGSPIQAPLDALEILLKQHQFTADQVAQVTVRVATREATIVDNRNLPDISLQHLVALMLVQRKLTFRSAHNAALMKDPAILSMRAKVKLVGDEQLEQQLPAREAVVEVRLKDGRKFTHRVDAVRGTAQNPMNREEVVAKSEDLIGPVLGSTQTRRLINCVLHLESMASVRSLRSVLQLAGRAQLNDGEGSTMP